MCFKVRFERAQSECLAERQREFVPNTAKEREPTVESLDRGSLRLKSSDVERRVRDGECRWTVSQRQEGAYPWMHLQQFESVYCILDPLLINLAACAGGGEEGKSDQFSSF